MNNNHQEEARPYCLTQIVPIFYLLPRRLLCLWCFTRVYPQRSACPVSLDDHAQITKIPSPTSLTCASCFTPLLKVQGIGECEVCQEERRN